MKEFLGFLRYLFSKYVNVVDTHYCQNKGSRQHGKERKRTE